MSFSVQHNPSPATAEQRAAVHANPGFGKYFTDHMVRIDYLDGAWGEGQVVPYGPIALDPATTVLHYGQEIFEGLKAYRQPDGAIAAFRPEANAARMARSAQRLAMAPITEELFLESLRAIVGVDRNWVPTETDHALYLRPFELATEIGMGVNSPSASYTYLVIASPVGSYFSSGVKPVSVWLSTDYTRAAPGGTGEAKCGGNYAAAFAGQAEATARGCDQVVWLDSHEHRYVEEMGGMNLFFVWGRGDRARVVTPPLTGTLLPGVTRDSLLTLAKDLGYAAEEAPLTTDEWQRACEVGDITEVFACGTAAVITPVGAVKSPFGEWTIGDGQAGPISMQLREHLVGIHRGTAPDTHGWMTRLA